MSGERPDFSNVDAWVFDLDNTLYPASCRLFDQMHVKMGEYVMRHFNVEFAEAKRILDTVNTELAAAGAP